jgi:hypothetical protein
MESTLAYVAAVMVGAWGVLHVIPTALVVRGFEPITSANRYVIVQEWIAEGITMPLPSSLPSPVLGRATHGSECAHTSRALLPRSLSLPRSSRYLIGVMAWSLLRLGPDQLRQERLNAVFNAVTDSADFIE